ncbi:hypothetical protein IHE55_01665 [Streptomyces pactum]|uniref:4-oxalocrotonate tautomerase domain-containing protein n=1 Tax=Streptomyces pactum TaxID=68249 RepID=A0ABS0NEE9_9ACTN|nr:hypothetical protein [Streptomyces pactum]MBH5333579.1 hypothetical protein [Streptomyces pactum]
MPHFQVRVAEQHLDGTAEPKLIAGLTDAVTQVFGERMRALVVVELFGVPDGRWGVGGVPVDGPAPDITLHMREGAFHRPEIPDAPARLIAAATEAVTAALGATLGAGATVRLVGVPAGRSGVGGQVV